MLSKRIVFRLLKYNIREFSVKRKFPINPESEKQLPVFDYTISRTTYNRIYVWGCASTGALGILYKHNEIEYKTSQRRPKRSTFAEQHDVTTVGCGYGFTLFGVNSSTNVKLFGTGLNTDSQLGYHEVRNGKPLEVLFLPQPIILQYKNVEKAKIIKIRGGRAHSLVLTNEGVYLLGNNIYGQCGRQIIPDESYQMSRYIHHIEKVDGKEIKDIACGQDHSILVTQDGSVYSCGWGADGQTGLGHYNSESEFTKVQGDIASENIVKVATTADFVLALNDKGDVFGWGNTEYAQISTKDGSQQICNPIYLEMCKNVGKIRDIAAGGSFCMIVNDKGEVFVWGYGLLGVGPSVQSTPVPVQIPSTLFGVNDFQPDTVVKSVHCGMNHLCAITNYGDLYMWGRNKHNCLGLGDDKDQTFPLRVSVGGLVTDVVCGVDHNVVMCKPYI
ncbi:hypothetical protein RN001_010164 [Aquatica leii]|uniref:RCC1-like G exchanging factor-like protein n=1 Tax=Aquatica leii TaxID=1421715 RepID=A0AAN7P7J3_9COLE|nr:hypothetical protein RN001_010164 [Aquatica leii]